MFFIIFMIILLVIFMLVVNTSKEQKEKFLFWRKPEAPVHKNVYTIERNN